MSAIFIFVFNCTFQNLMVSNIGIVPHLYPALPNKTFAFTYMSEMVEGVEHGRIWEK